MKLCLIYKRNPKKIIKNSFIIQNQALKMMKIGHKLMTHVVILVDKRVFELADEMLILLTFNFSLRKMKTPKNTKTSKITS